MVSGSNVTVLSLGTCSLTASQTGTSLYAPATPVMQTFLVYTPPSVTIEAPAANPTLSLTVTVSGWALETTAVLFPMPSGNHLRSQRRLDSNIQGKISRAHIAEYIGEASSPEESGRQGGSSRGIRRGHQNHHIRARRRDDFHQSGIQALTADRIGISGRTGAVIVEIVKRCRGTRFPEITPPPDRSRRWESRRP
jgi:hypothetical protein